MSKNRGWDNYRDSASFRELTWPEQRAKKQYWGESKPKGESESIEEKSKTINKVMLSALKDFRKLYPNAHLDIGVSHYSSKEEK
jgi:hypothetical protein